MRFWHRYWNRLWDLSREREAKKDETPEYTPGRVQMPLTTAYRLLRRQGSPGSTGLRGSAARRLQQFVGNHRLPAGAQVYQDEALAQALNARAATVGDQIVVGRATDAADSELLSHEAAHLVQAQSRGVRPGISKPGGATEHEARQAARATEAGQAAGIAHGGGPVPAIQRQEQSGETPAPVNPVVRRESVRIMLFLQYQQQGGQGAFTLTPALQNELRRLLPDLTVADIAQLWTPEPGGPAEAFQRIVDAGHLPLFAVTPEQEPEIVPQPEQAAEPEPEPESAVSPAGLGMVGFHYRLNPRVPPPISATVRQHVSSRGIPLSYRQIEALLAGRNQAIGQIETILGSVASGLGAADRTSLAETIADALLDYSLQGQLQRESPTRVEEIEQQTEAVQAAQGALPDMLQRIPVGASITIYF
jgi:hypothetical protein